MYFKQFPRNRGTTHNQVQLYQKPSLQALFNDLDRSETVMQHHSLGYKYADQTVYGCGPQSIPIVDPRLVLEYQKSRMAANLFERTIGGSLIKVTAS